ncbi:ashwin-like [Gouania willdenowi]|uniref:Ashwin n=1 Tax=Gouania willdenowi TaxID=441366 RepID=A0A8C5GJC8_GOUWI|nr:ashwin [Gouania willdenowi]XP_028296755.1 ashwin-like [Gouania willdenowi]
MADHNTKAQSSSDVDFLLHPELLSQDFLQLVLTERNVSTGGCGSRDRLTELFLRHVVPLPQRALPDSRWGRKMERSRGRLHTGGYRTDSSNNDQSRKRPLIVFDGSSSHSCPVKVKKPDVNTNRLKPPPAANLSNPIRKLSSNTSSSSPSSFDQYSTDKTNLKREANSSTSLKSSEVKKKIQHVTWP